MSLAAYRGHSLTINNVGIPMDSLTPDPAIEAYAEMGGASTISTISGEKQATPVMKGTTRAIKELIDAVGLFGYPVTGVSTSKVIAYLGKFTSGSTFASGSVHKSITVNKGMVVIESISGKGNEPLSANIAVYTEYDGTNAPLAIASNVALPSTPARLTTLFVAGPIDNGGGAVEAQGWTITLGPDIYSARKDGEVYPTLVCARSWKLAVEADTLDAAALSANGGVTDLIVYARKCNPNGAGRVADATEEHIAFTMAAAYNYAGQGSLNFPNEGSFQHKWTPIFDGTNAAIAVDTTAAISV